MAPSATNDQNTSKKYLDKVNSRKKALDKAWYPEAKDALRVYDAEKPDASNINAGTRTPFNILFSNTETLMPALYSTPPRPDVTRRFDSGPPDQLNHDAAEFSNRFLTYVADTNADEYDTYDEAAAAAVLSALLPGMGQVRIQAHAYDGENTNEICFEQVAYDRFLWGWARTWSQVPWVAFGHDLLKPDFERIFPEFCTTQLYKDFKWEDSTNTKEPTSDEGTKGMPTVLVWEFWDWNKKEIKFVCEKFAEKFLKEDQYPFDLSCRFPCPEPLKLVKKVQNLTPTVPYSIYRKKAEQLNMISRRIDGLVKVVKARGAYDSTIGDDLAKLFDDDDDIGNTLIATAGGIADRGGFDKAVWFFPIDQVVQTLRELYLDEQACKQVIYEVMGIADIMRGASQASETLGAQQIKNQWGTLRLKRSQKDVQLFCRDLFRIALEFGMNLLAPATLKQMTGCVNMLQVQKQAFEQAAQQQAMQAQQMAAQQQPQAPGPDGQPAQAAPPPQQPQIDPQMAFAAQLPTVEEMIEVLKSNPERQYRIDIETNSTLDVDATEDKQNIVEFMNAFGQMMSGIQPLVQEGILPFGIAKAMILEVSRKFKVGRELEDFLRTMKQPDQSQNAAAQQSQQQLEGMKQMLQLQSKEGELVSKQHEIELMLKELQLGRQLVAKEGQLQVALVKIQEGKLDEAVTALKGDAAQVGVSFQTQKAAVDSSKQQLQHATQIAGKDSQLRMQQEQAKQQQTQNGAQLAQAKLQKTQAKPKVQ